MTDAFWIGVAVTAVSVGIWWLTKTSQTPKRPFKNHNGFDSPKEQRPPQVPEHLEDDATYYEHHRLNYQRLRRKIDLDRRRAFEQEQIASFHNQMWESAFKKPTYTILIKNPNKYVITDEDDCPICFGDIELEIVPCGHGICKACFAGYNNVCCLCKELVATTIDYKPQ